MPSYRHYVVQDANGNFGTYDVNEEEVPDVPDAQGTWGVNMTVAQQIDDGAKVEVVDGELIVTPQPTAPPRPQEL